MWVLRRSFQTLTDCCVGVTVKRCISVIRIISASERSISNHTPSKPCVTHQIVSVELPDRYSLHARKLWNAFLCAAAAAAAADVTFFVWNLFGRSDLLSNSHYFHAINPRVMMSCSASFVSLTHLSHAQQLMSNRTFVKVKRRIPVPVPVPATPTDTSKPNPTPPALKSDTGTGSGMSTLLTEATDLPVSVTMHRPKVLVAVALRLDWFPARTGIIRELIQLIASYACVPCTYWYRYRYSVSRFLFVRCCRHLLTQPVTLLTARRASVSMAGTGSGHFWLRNGRVF